MICILYYGILVSGGIVSVIQQSNSEGRVDALVLVPVSIVRDASASQLLLFAVCSLLFASFLAGSRLVCSAPW